MYNPTKFVQYKDLPNLTPMFGNIGNSWNNPVPNDLYIKGVPKNIFQNAASAGNIGVGLDTIRTFTIVANSLNNNQDYIDFEFLVLFATNDNDKRLQLEVDGQAQYNSALFDQDSGSALLQVRLYRFTAQVLIYRHLITWFDINRDGAGTMTGNGRMNAFANIIDLGSAKLDTTNIDVVLKGEATANDDVVSLLINVDLCRNS